MKGKTPVKVTHKDANLPYMIPIDVDSLFDLAKAAYAFLPKYSERFFQQKKHCFTNPSPDEID